MFPGKACRAPSLINNGFIEHLNLNVGKGFRVYCYEGFTHTDGTFYKDYMCAESGTSIQLEECKVKFDKFVFFSQIKAIAQKLLP